jgi:hypothetical protein
MDILQNNPKCFSGLSLPSAHTRSKACSQDEDSSSSFRVLSAFQKDDTPVDLREVSSLPLGSPALVNFVSSSYRIVFSFDVSPSMAAVV